MAGEKTYVQELEEKLEATLKRAKEGEQAKQLKHNAPVLFDVVDGEISLAVNRAFGDKPLPYEEYLSAHGEVKAFRRVRNLLDAKEVQANQAQQEVDAIQSNLKQIKDDKAKQQ